MSCSGAVRWTSATWRSESPSSRARPGGEVGDALGVLVRVVVAVAGRAQEALQELLLGGRGVPAARQRLRGERGLELGLARAQPALADDRAQPSGGDRAELLVGGGDRPQADHGRALLEVERVEALAQLVLGGVDGDHGRGR